MTFLAWLLRMAALAGGALALLVFAVATWSGGPAPDSAGPPTSKATAGRGPAAVPETGPAPGDHGTGRIVLTQEQVNAQVAQALQQHGGAVPVREVHITLVGENRVRATGRATLPGQGEVPLTVDLTLTSRDGTLAVAITGAQSGGLPLPSALVEGTVQSALRGTPYQDLSHITLPEDIAQVRVEQGRLIIEKKAG